MKRKLTLPILLVSTLFATSASAVITQTNVYDLSETFFTVSSTDLINQGQSTFSSQTSSNFSVFSNSGGTSNVAALNNGVTGPSSSTLGPALNETAISIPNYNWTTTFTLNTSVNTYGYDLTSIQSITAWGGDRSNQKYEVLLRHVGSGTFISIGTFNYGPLNISSPTGGSTRISLTNGGSDFLGVDAIQFNFMRPDAPNGPSAQTAYREIDVFGVAAIPEPSSAAMLIAGAFAGIALLRRKRS